LRTEVILLPEKSLRDEWFFLTAHRCITSEKGGEMMNNVSREQTQEGAVGKLVKETYHAPHMLVFGDVMTLARGSGSDESDGCSSGYYDE